MKNSRPAVAAAAIALLSLAPAAASAQTAGDWRYQAALYLYLPTIGGSTNFPPSGGGSSVSVDANTILEHLKMAFMGNFEASNGRWGVFTDLLYVNVGNTKDNTNSFSIGNVGIPAGTSAHVGYDLKGWVWTLAGTYRTVNDPDFTLDLLGGTRLLDVTQTVNWNLTGIVGQYPVIDRAGSRETSGQNWDAIVGVKGRVAFGDGKWFAPYYLDIGTGQSKFTWQAIAGVGYTFGWGDVVAAWRYIDYQMKSGEPVQDLTFNGPGLAAIFRW